MFYIYVNKNRSMIFFETNVIQPHKLLVLL